LRLFIRLFLTAVLLTSTSSYAYIVRILAPPSGLYLQVGDGVGRLNLNTINSSSGRNSTVNNVRLTVPAASLAQGPLAMTTDSSVSTSPIDNYTNYCSVPAQVFIGGFYRTPNHRPAVAALRAQAPAALTGPSIGSIPINTISWVSSGDGDNPNDPTVPSGTFNSSGAQLLRTIGNNVWFESCMQFNYANNQLPPAGTYNGQVTYSLTAP
jgi:hypothetical protein